MNDEDIKKMIQDMRNELVKVTEYKFYLIGKALTKLIQDIDDPEFTELEKIIKQL